MKYRCHPCVGRAARAAGMLAAVATAIIPGSMLAHEGHAALPTTGATVDGDVVLISEAARKGLGLETGTVTLQDLSRVLRVRAQVELPWDGQAMVTTLVPGRVQSILVKPGETVEAGQALARIESLDVETLQLTMLQAAEEVALAARLLKQRRPLAESGAIPGKSLLEAETRLRQKRAQLAVAERKLLALGLSQETLQQVQTLKQPIPLISVTSPIGGVVMHADVRAGQFVDTEQHLFNIVDRSEVLVVGEVLETDAWQIELGQMVEAVFASQPDTALNGKISRLRLSLDSQKRALHAVVPMENRDGALRPGMSGRMSITVDESKQAIVCPTAALIETPSRAFVLLRQGEGKYQRREVEIGLRTPELVEISEGLFPGDRVIVTGTRLLASMFHTDRKSRPSSSASAATQPGTGAARSADFRRSATTIPVAQAVLALPTSGKAFATPVIEGRVAAIHVEPGQAVEAGQILAELDSQQLRTLQLELLETQEMLRWVTETVERVEPLARSGDYPSSQFWEYETEQQTLEYKLQNVERKLAMVGLSPEAIDRLRRVEISESVDEAIFVTMPVHAPAAGQIADFDVLLGQIVHADDALFEIQDRSTVWIEGHVFEQHASKVEVGQTAHIRFPAYPKLRLSGQVVRTAPRLHASARVLPVWIEVENPGQMLREGMLAQVEILPQPAPGDIPLQASPLQSSTQE